MSKERIYAHGKSGSVYETVHKDDFINSAALGAIALTDGTSEPLNPYQRYKVRSAKTELNEFIGRPYFKIPAGNEYKIEMATADAYRYNYDFEFLDHYISSSSGGYQTVTLIFTVNGIQSTAEIAVPSGVAVEPFTIVFKDCEELYVFNDGANIYQPSHLYKHRISVSKAHSTGNTPLSFNANCIVYSSSATPITADTFKDEYLVGARVDSVNMGDLPQAEYLPSHLWYSSGAKTLYIYYISSFGSLANPYITRGSASVPIAEVTITDTVEEV